ncbi:Kinesin-like protein KIF11-B [Tribolium castaneum]|uniref:Kinesin-like protein n=1 Tax=Tribolium castaneum TaxID=7070 RepID=D6W7W8_TRICA|nr:PREDICTED: kinesin-like protein KIF11-B [Tribolium castaneum]EFA11147.1 Kinesin-like protein KIF11-B [Tribolium castaneum]|eukprot:XP_968183.1 PREDICTED: kinesin-like protein KIF11-B [Tribolium castaneum]
MNERKNQLFRVQVSVRQRPYTKDEIELKKTSIVKVSNQNELTLQCGSNGKNYTFDRVFKSGASQAEVYDVVVRPLVDSMLSGCTCTVFAYGPTGTGKTYTMIGDSVRPTLDFLNDPSVGMVPRAAADIFNRLSQLGVQFNVTVSFVEIYNEEVRDLLISDTCNLRIYDDPDNKGATCIKGVSEVPVKNCTELFELLMIGASDRHMASTNLNRQSSRSHTIFTIVATIRELSNGVETIKTGKINLIDLAGSENIGRSGATEMRAREAGTINKSLLTLAKVIKALALKSQHIPYRESKLTRILQDSLGGKSKTSIITTFSPSPDVFEETISTLDYAHMARTVSNCPTYNITTIRRDHLTKELESEVKSLRLELNAARTGDGFYVDIETYEKLHLDAKVKHERVVTLLSEITKLDGVIKYQTQCSDELGKNYQESVTKLEAVTKELEQETIKQKESEYAITRMSDKLSQLEEQSKVLRDVCHTSTKHGDIYYQKYDSQCDATLHKAKIAKEMVAVSTTNLRGIGNALEEFGEKERTCLDEIATSNAHVKHNVLNDLSRLNRLLNDVAAFSSSLTCTPETLLGNTEFTESGARATLKSVHTDNYALMVQYFAKIRTTLSNLKGHVDDIKASVAQAALLYHDNVASQFSLLSDVFDKFYSLMHRLYVGMQKRHARIQGSIKRSDESIASWEKLIELNAATCKDAKLELESISHMREYIDEMTELLRERMPAVDHNLNTFFCNFNEQTAHPLLNHLRLRHEAAGYEIGESQATCLEQAQQHYIRNQKYMVGFFTAIAKGLEVHNKNVAKGRKALVEEAESILENQQRVTAQSSKAVASSLSNLALNEDFYLANTVKVSENTVENLEQKLVEVDFTIKTGDTPVKPTYDYPKKIDSVLSKEVLKREFKKSLLQEKQDNSNESTDGDK